MTINSQKGFNAESGTARKISTRVKNWISSTSKTVP